MQVYIFLNHVGEYIKVAPKDWPYKSHQSYEILKNSEIETELIVNTDHGPEPIFKWHTFSPLLYLAIKDKIKE